MRTLISLLLLCGTVLGQSYTVMVDGTGKLLAPTNFFAGNTSNLFQVLSWNSNQFYVTGQTNISLLTNGPVNVKWFGAKGDGITDDTAAIQTAINYAATNGVPLKIPKGTYIVSSVMTIPQVQGPSSNFQLIGDDGFPVGAMPTNTGTILQASTSVNGVLQTTRLATNTLAYWSQNIVIRNIQIWGKKHFSATFSASEQTTVGIDLSGVLFLTLENVGVQGFGIGININGGSEIRSQGLLNLVNNYDGMHLTSTAASDLQMFISDLQADDNQRYAIWCDFVRTLNIERGEIIDDQYNPLWNYPRILINNAQQSGNFTFHGLNAENHTWGQPLILVTNSPQFASIDIADGTFQSFLNAGGTNNNPLVWIDSCNFDYVGVRNCNFDRVFFGTVMNPYVNITGNPGQNVFVRKGQIDVDGNTPPYADFAVSRVSALITNQTDFYHPSDWVNVFYPQDFVKADDRLLNYSFSAGYSTSISCPDFGATKIYWTGAGPNSATLAFPYSTKSPVYLVTCLEYDNGGTNYPSVDAVGSLNSSVGGYLVAPIKVGTATNSCGTVMQRYAIPVIVSDTGTLYTNGVSLITIGHIFGGAGMTNTGLESFGVYLPRKYVPTITDSLWQPIYSNVTNNLPPVQSFPGIKATYKAIGTSANVQLNTVGADLLDGGTSYNLSSSNKFITLKNDGTNWWNIGSN